jgi:hypothetical protein
MHRRTKHTRLVRAFLATPSDTAAEIAMAFRAVETINRGNGREEGFRIELLHWTTDTYPAVGSDTQSVVTSQIADYELLIVILNQQFGTRTPRANSGTEEEYDRAFLRYLENTSSVSILVYFADHMVRLHSVDPTALGQVKAFRLRLEREGVLYKTYHDLPELERLLSEQLPRACRAFLSLPPGPRASVRRTHPSPRSVQFPDWTAESRIVLPQSANYIEYDLSPYRFTRLCFRGRFHSDSAYFRFGFKLSGARQPLLGDTTIQTLDPNMVFHIGRNTDRETLFFTIYRQGRRIGRDHVLLDNVSPDALELGFTLEVDNVFAFQVNQEIVHEDRLPAEARDRLALLTWADEHDCSIAFRNIRLDMTPTQT